MTENSNPQSAVSNLRAAAIGVGSLGRHHARNYAELSREGRVEFVGACDVDAETREKVAADNGCAPYADWRELIGKVDMVSVATPTETHSEIACAFLENGTHRYSFVNCSEAKHPLWISSQPTQNIRLN